MIFEKGSFIRKYLPEVKPISGNEFIEISRLTLEDLTHGILIDLSPKSPYIKFESFGRKRKRSQPVVLFEKKDFYDFFSRIFQNLEITKNPALQKKLIKFFV